MIVVVGYCCLDFRLTSFIMLLLLLLPPPLLLLLLLLLLPPTIDSGRQGALVRYDDDGR